MIQQDAERGLEYSMKVISKKLNENLEKDERPNDGNLDSRRRIQIHGTRYADNVHQTFGWRIFVWPTHL